MRGKITCESSGHKQHDDYGDEREWIERGDAKQQAPQEKRSGNGSDCAENEAAKYWSETLHHYESEELARGRPLERFAV